VSTVEVEKLIDMIIASDAGRTLEADKLLDLARQQGSRPDRNQDGPATGNPQTD
jgi:hypothetical protein